MLYTNQITQRQMVGLLVNRQPQRTGKEAHLEVHDSDNKT